jgi:hypothetical protein
MFITFVLVLQQVLDRQNHGLCTCVKGHVHIHKRNIPV